MRGSHGYSLCARDESGIFSPYDTFDSGGVRGGADRDPVGLLPAHESVFRGRMESHQLYFYAGDPVHHRRSVDLDYLEHAFLHDE